MAAHAEVLDVLDLEHVAEVTAAFHVQLGRASRELALELGDSGLGDRDLALRRGERGLGSRKPCLGVGDLGCRVLEQGPVAVQIDRDLDGLRVDRRRLGPSRNGRRCQHASAEGADEHECGGDAEQAALPTDQNAAPFGAEPFHSPPCARTSFPAFSTAAGSVPTTSPSIDDPLRADLDLLFRGFFSIAPCRPPCAAREGQEGSRPSRPPASSGSCPVRSRRHSIAAAACSSVLITALAVVVAGPPAGAAAPAKRKPVLQVLITNDDGVSADGIDALVEAVRALPRVKVTVVAPATNQSGTSDKTTPGSLVPEAGDDRLRLSGACRARISRRQRARGAGRSGSDEA